MGLGGSNGQKKTWTDSREKKALREKQRAIAGVQVWGGVGRLSSGKGRNEPATEKQSPGESSCAWTRGRAAKQIKIWKSPIPKPKQTELNQNNLAANLLKKEAVEKVVTQKENPYSCPMMWCGHSGSPTRWNPKLNQKTTHKQTHKHWTVVQPPSGAKAQNGSTGGWPWSQLTVKLWPNPCSTQL